MAYQATIIPVMIASPADVSEEREAARRVIHEWNDINFFDSDILLAPIGWETHSSPELGVRPQELINKRLLKDCDLLIGIFWTRVGTPTGEAKSGSIEEIERHVAAGKPAMIYFSSRPVAPQSIDPSQFDQVKAFQNRCKSLGLIEFFDSIDEFKGKFSRQLTICLTKNEYIKSTLANFSDNRTVGHEIDSHIAEVSRLSPDAAILLKAASAEPNGQIICIEHMGGKTIQTGNQRYGGNPRENARWQSALDELESNGLVKALGYKRQIFELTHAGWTTADGI